MVYAAVGLRAQEQPPGTKEQSYGTLQGPQRPHKHKESTLLLNDPGQEGFQNHGLWDPGCLCELGSNPLP